MGDVRIEYPLDPNDVPHVYSNHQIMFVSVDDVYIDFAQLTPQTMLRPDGGSDGDRSAVLCSRVILTRSAAKDMVAKLGALLKKIPSKRS